MRIWLLGTEGRMQAIARHLKRFGHDVYFSGPGCPGTSRHATQLFVNLKAYDFAGMAELARRLCIELIVPGSEDLFDAGVVNELSSVCPVFGPTRVAAMIETDKKFSHELMERLCIPQATTSWYHGYDRAAARAALHFNTRSDPLVIKPLGLTGGKGVVIARDFATADHALHVMLVEGKYKDAGARVGLAEYLPGAECTAFVLSDGHEDSIKFLASARDCKAAWPAKNGKPAGPNTGGMWAISPIPEWDEFLQDTTMRYARSVVARMRRTGMPFRGCLYISLKLTPTGTAGRVLPKVVEFNGRFGDPEAQAVFERWDEDMAPYLLACTQEKGLAKLKPIQLNPRIGGCLVICAKGYPDAPQLDKVINQESLRRAESLEVHVDECGTKLSESGQDLLVGGGRVINLKARQDSLEALRSQLNHAAYEIQIEGGSLFRDDLGDPLAAS